MCSSKFSLNQKNLSLIRPEGNLTEQTHLDFRFMAIPSQHLHIKRIKKQMKVIIGKAGNFMEWLLKDGLISYSFQVICPLISC